MIWYLSNALVIPVPSQYRPIVKPIYYTIIFLQNAYKIRSIAHSKDL